jgi:hypothetical protein
MASFIDTAIPIILIAVVVFFLWGKLGKHIISLYETIKVWFKPKHKAVENPNTYDIIEYD